LAIPEPHNVGEVTPPSVGFGRRKRLLLAIFPVLLIAVAWLLLPMPFRSLAEVGGNEPLGLHANGVVPRTGASLYLQHCAYCHGERGDGAGPAAVSLFPWPRNFGEAKFRLKTTAKDLPTDHDLSETIRRGIPGSAMPPFPEFSEEDRNMLVDHIRLLTRTGIYDRLRRKAEDDDGDLSAIGRRIESQTEVGPPIEIPKTFPVNSEASRANGKQLYLKTCAACHGPEGRGDGPQVKELKNDDGAPNRPRDLTSGVFKGGREKERLYARIVVGMPGTPMPASTHLKPEEVGDLINFILSLSYDKAHVATGSHYRN
jgi:mono/diheme cytochrome c family protein